MAKFRVNRTFYDDRSGKWHVQGAIIDIAIEAAKNLIVARVINPILDALLPAKKEVETADKALGNENATKNQKGNK